MENNVGLSESLAYSLVMMLVETAKEIVPNWEECRPAGESYLKSLHRWGQYVMISYQDEIGSTRNFGVQVGTANIYQGKVKNNNVAIKKIML